MYVRAMWKTRGALRAKRYGLRAIHFFVQRYARGATRGARVAGGTAAGWDTSTRHDGILKEIPVCNAMRGTNLRHERAVSMSWDSWDSWDNLPKIFLEERDERRGECGRPVTQIIPVILIQLCAMPRPIDKS